MRKVLMLSVTLILIFAAMETGAQNSKNVDFIGTTEGYVQCVAVQGNFAYAGAGGVFLVLDVSDPASPNLVGRSVIMAGWIKTIRLHDSYAYLVGTFGFKVVDISDPTDPHEVGCYLIPEASCCAYDIYISGSHAFVAAGQGGIKILDISDPTDPHEVSSCLTGSCFLASRVSSMNVYVSGSYIYVCDYGGYREHDSTRFSYEGALMVIDITDITNPLQLWL